MCPWFLRPAAQQGNIIAAFKLPILGTSSEENGRRMNRVNRGVNRNTVAVSQFGLHPSKDLVFAVFEGEFFGETLLIKSTTLPTMQPSMSDTTGGKSLAPPETQMILHTTFFPVALQNPVNTI